jgi:hypothetical protein
LSFVVEDGSDGGVELVEGFDVAVDARGVAVLEREYMERGAISGEDGQVRLISEMLSWNGSREAGR